MLSVFVLVMIIGASLTQPSNVLAGIIEVDTVNDELNGGTGNKQCSLREAIENANNDNGLQVDCAPGTGADEIILPTGTYTLEGASGDNDNLSGDLDITGVLTIRGAGSRSTRIQAGTQSPVDGVCVDCVDRVFEIRNGATVVIHDVTIRFGLAPAGIGANAGSQGGGILNNGNLTLNDCTVTHNHAGKGGDGNINTPWGGWGGNGGGIYVNDYDILTLNRTSVNNNHAGDGGLGYQSGAGGSGGRGGGISAEDLSEINLYNAYVNDNQGGKGGDGGDGPGMDAGNGGYGGYGGGIYCDDCIMELWVTSVLRNKSGVGGNGGDASGGDFNGGNAGISGFGSGLYTSGSSADLSMNYSTVGFNESGEIAFGGAGSGLGFDGYDGALGGGGGMSLGNGANGNIQTSTIYQNTGYSGGGLQVTNGTQLLMINSTLSGNNASNNGGGIYVSGTGTNADLIFVTITDNLADWDEDGSGEGGGFYNTANLTVRNTIVANNTDDGDENPDCSGTGTSLDYNLIGIGDSADCTFTPLSNDLVGTELSPLNPLLTSLSDNGGYNLTHAFIKGSPALNHIDTGSLGCGTGYKFDQRGVVRFSPCDIGAYEIDIAETLYLPLVIR
jgi:CSLREA domain-containing protein